MTTAGGRLRQRIAAIRALAAGVLYTSRDERAQAMVEYALILALVTAVGVVGLALIGSFPVRIFNGVNSIFP